MVQQQSGTDPRHSRIGTPSPEQGTQPNGELVRAQFGWACGIVFERLRVKGQRAALPRAAPQAPSRSMRASHVDLTTDPAQEARATPAVATRRCAANPHEAKSTAALHTSPGQKHGANPLAARAAQKVVCGLAAFFLAAKNARPEKMRSALVAGSPRCQVLVGRDRPGSGARICRWRGPCRFARAPVPDAPFRSRCTGSAPAYPRCSSRLLLRSAGACNAQTRPSRGCKPKAPRAALNRTSPKALTFRHLSTIRRWRGLR